MRRVKPEAFDSWEDAFSVCRERDRPIKIYLADAPEMYWIYPSGMVRECRAMATDRKGAD